MQDWRAILSKRFILPRSPLCMYVLATHYSVNNAVHMCAVGDVKLNS